MQENIRQALAWRYATKQFDTEKKLSTEEIDGLLETMRMAPTSFGLQPWKAILVKDPELRKKLRDAGWGQAQVTDASHFVVLAVRKTIDEKYVDEYLALVAKTRGITVGDLAGFRQMLVKFVNGSDPIWLREWAARQAYIALGFALEAAALQNIDAAPMEGFDPQKFDEILGLAALDLESKVMVGFGYRSAEDKYAELAKVRFPREELVVEM